MSFIYHFSFRAPSAKIYQRYFLSTLSFYIFKVYYIGLRGEFKKADRDQILVANYELNANPADHKNPLTESSGHQIQ